MSKTCVQPEPCTCGCVVEFDTPEKMHLQYCSVHKAAYELLDACKVAQDLLKDSKDGAAAYTLQQLTNALQKAGFKREPTPVTAKQPPQNAAEKPQ